MCKYCLVSWRIKHRFKKWNKEETQKRSILSRKEVKTILDDCINDVGDTKGIKIVFTFFKDDFMKSVNAGAKVLFLPKQIWVNSEWAAHLTYNQHNKNTWNAFLITVGHELTHKEKEFSVRGLKNNDKQFVLYKLQY